MGQRNQHGGQGKLKEEGEADNGLGGIHPPWSLQLSQCRFHQIKLEQALETRRWLLSMDRALSLLPRVLLVIPHSPVPASFVLVCLV